MLSLCNPKVSSALAALRATLGAGVSIAAVLFGAGLASGVQALQLDIINGGVPTSVRAGVNERGVWRNAGTAGGQNIDIVATITTATLNHTFDNFHARPSISAPVQDAIWVRWSIHQADTFGITTNSGGVPVVCRLAKHDHGSKTFKQWVV